MTKETSPQKPSLLERLNLFSVALSLIMSICGGYASVRVAEAEITGRVATVENKQAMVISQLVPRNEHEARWNAIAEQLNALQADIKEIRHDQKDLLMMVAQAHNTPSR